MFHGNMFPSHLYHLFLKEILPHYISQKSGELDSWIETAIGLKIGEIDRYISEWHERGSRDRKNAIYLPYNSGLAKGSVNNIKLTKYIMYGWNDFALLKAKLLINNILSHQLNLEKIYLVLTYNSLFGWIFRMKGVSKRKVNLMNKTEMEVFLKLQKETMEFLCQLVECPRKAQKADRADEPVNHLRKKLFMSSGEKSKSDDFLGRLSQVEVEADLEFMEPTLKTVGGGFKC